MAITKVGFFNGNPEIALNAPVDIVMQTYNYEMFIRQYEEVDIEINKEVR